jgi:alpha-tubulin suppressor-like RCC1 family protein
LNHYSNYNQAAAGLVYAAVGVTEQGRLYTWGWGGAVGSAGFSSADLGAGQLGHGDEMDYHEPKQVQRLLMARGKFRDLRQNIPGIDSSWQAVQVSCARNHTAAVVEVNVSPSELN